MPRRPGRGARRAGTLKTDPDALSDYGRDESDLGTTPADLVVLPRTTAEVSRVLKIAREHRVPVTPCGARSGKSGGSMPVHGGIVLSVERMNAIKEISTEDLVAVVEPGVVTGDLMKAVEAKGLFYPPDPNSWEWCTLGGNIAENAGGPRALKYGVTRDYVLGMEWVMPDGEVLPGGPAHHQGSGRVRPGGAARGKRGHAGNRDGDHPPAPAAAPRGADRAPRLRRRPSAAARAVSAVLAAGVLPRTLELMDDLAVKAVDGKGFNFPPGTGRCVLAEVDGNVPEAVFGELARLGEIAEQHGGEGDLARPGSRASGRSSGPRGGR